MATWLSESTPGGGHQWTYNTICPPYILGCWAHNRDCLVSPTHWPASHHAWTCDTSLTHLEKQGRGRHRQAAKNMTLISFKSFPLWTDTPNTAVLWQPPCKDAMSHGLKPQRGCLLCRNRGNVCHLEEINYSKIRFADAVTELQNESDVFTLWYKTPMCKHTYTSFI